MLNNERAMKDKGFSVHHSSFSIKRLFLSYRLALEAFDAITFAAR